MFFSVLGKTSRRPRALGGGELGSAQPPCSWEDRPLSADAFGRVQLLPNISLVPAYGGSFSKESSATLWSGFLMCYFIISLTFTLFCSDRKYFQGNLPDQHQYKTDLIIVSSISCFDFDLALNILVI